MVDPALDPDLHSPKALEIEGSHFASQTSERYREKEAMVAV